MLEVIVVIVIIAAIASARKKKRPMEAGDFAAFQERRERSARVKTIIGVVFLVISVLVWVAVLLSPPKEGSLDDYNMQKLEELSQQGLILETDTTEENYNSVQSRLSYSGATAEEYEHFWQAIDSARFTREAEFWSGMTPLIEEADAYMQNALMRAQ